MHWPFNQKNVFFYSSRRESRGEGLRATGLWKKNCCCCFYWFFKYLRLQVNIWCDNIARSCWSTISGFPGNQSSAASSILMKMQTPAQKLERTTPIRIPPWCPQKCISGWAASTAPCRPIEESERRSSQHSKWKRKLLTTKVIQSCSRSNGTEIFFTFVSRKKQAPFRTRKKQSPLKLQVFKSSLINVPLSAKTSYHRAKERPQDDNRCHCDQTCHIQERAWSNSEDLARKMHTVTKVRKLSTVKMSFTTKKITHVFAHEQQWDDANAPEKKFLNKRKKACPKHKSHISPTTLSRKHAKAFRRDILERKKQRNLKRRKEMPFP